MTTRKELVSIIIKAKALAESENDSICVKVFDYLLEAEQRVPVSSRSSEEPTEEAEED